VLARQALALAVFLDGEDEAAAALEQRNLEAFVRAGSRLQIADSETLLAAAAWRTGDTERANELLADAARIFLATDQAAGMARILGMAAIVQLTAGDPELGTRLGGGAYRLVREKGVMLAPVVVLRLPEPHDLAVERLGPERAQRLEAEGAESPVSSLVDAIVATAPVAMTGAARPSH
jgi:hypothetical protein